MQKGTRNPCNKQLLVTHMEKVNPNVQSKLQLLTRYLEIHRIF